ncbi:HAD-like domain-containing protein [Ilyonectria robusta]|uniref:HAD-like domain-containing protein n=1 Tax=Ilyonectria robusta TaxID=1079257 RepID=UPI001E8ED6F2|nr:HAD-like domain-containing protein [Ilyonectria robusta]KAH8729753.1 HAD-like domain-containing protein [Ilyonectria robusta]
MPSCSLPVPSTAVEQARASLRTKSWFGFDLDDTLHEFRSASRAATTHCLSVIANENPSVSLGALQTRYREVLMQGTSNAFVDGKTSHDYRRERFSATLDHFGLSHGLINELLASYERVLVENLTLKPGAESLLRAIKSSGRKIAVITEGPQDAQERALRDLGIAEHVDFLATTNHFGVSKTTGLFQKVLDHLAIQPQEVIYVGDSMERDIVPAAADGIYAIHLDEKQSSKLILEPITVNSLLVLEDLLSPFSEA